MYTRPRWRGNTLILNVRAEPPFALAEAYLSKDRGKLRRVPGDLGGDAVQLEFPNAKAKLQSKKTARIVLSEDEAQHWMVLYLEVP